MAGSVGDGHAFDDPSVAARECGVQRRWALGLGGWVHAGIRNSLVLPAALGRLHDSKPDLVLLVRSSRLPVRQEVRNHRPDHVGLFEEEEVAAARDDV
jgi:hypothetical protein